MQYMQQRNIVLVNYIHVLTNTILPPSLVYWGHNVDYTDQTENLSI